MQGPLDAAACVSMMWLAQRTLHPGQRRKALARRSISGSRCSALAPPAALERVRNNTRHDVLLNKGCTILRSTRRL